MLSLAYRHTARGQLLAFVLTEADMPGRRLCGRLSEVKRTCGQRSSMSACDPKRSQQTNQRPLSSKKIALAATLASLGSLARLLWGIDRSIRTTVFVIALTGSICALTPNVSLAQWPDIREAKAIAEEGFIYGLPIVMNYAVM